MLFAFCLLLASFQSVFCQKRFDVEIMPSSLMDADKMTIQIDDGKNETSPKANRENEVIKLTGNYYGEYAQILIRYPSLSASNLYEVSTFFVQDRPAVIQFHATQSRDSIIGNYSLTNATDFKSDKLKMADYDSAAINDLRLFAAQYGSKLHEDSTVMNRFIALENQIYDADLNYVRNNLESYYAFTFFRRNFVKIQRLPPDSVLSLLELFPERFKNSEEGNAIRSLATGRTNVKLNGRAPAFESTDVHGQKVVLQEYLDKGYVLLDFWATWCGPCLEDMPELKAIHDEFGEKGLTVISIAYPSTVEQSRQDIKKYKMEWINVYDDADLINAYGGYLTIPRMFLLDRDGTIVFDLSDGPPETRMKRLKDLLSSVLND